MISFFPITDFEYFQVFFYINNALINIFVPEALFAFKFMFLGKFLLELLVKMTTETSNIINLDSKEAVIVSTHLPNRRNFPSTQYSYH